jgi:Effector-associated domain 1
MARSRIIGSRVTWWWGGLLFATVAGVAVSLVADHLWGGTAAGIIATVFFGVVAIFFGQFAIKPRLTPTSFQPRPSEELPSHAFPMPRSESAEIVSASESRPPTQAELITHETRLRVDDHSYPSTDSGDLLDSRNNLVECLADSIPDEEYIAQIADEAGLDKRHLKLNGTPSNRWSSVIRRAEVEKKEHRIVERAGRISPDQALRRAIQDYIRRRT